MTPKTIKSRIQICACLAGIPAFLIGLRLFWLQTVRHENLAGMAERSFSRTVSEVGPRGRIYTINGQLLAESIVTWDAAIFKKDLKNPARDIAALSTTLKLPPDFAARVRRGINFVPVKKGLDREAYDAVNALKINGLVLEPRQTRYYPSGDLARDVIGLVGPEKGLTGTELLYDKVLKGTVDKREVIRDATGRIIFQDNIGEASHPRDLYLTLDRDIQYFTQEALRVMADKTKAALGMAIVQDPDTGEILAMTSWPEDNSKLPPVEWVYEPGSTFKSITVAAAIEKNIVTEKDTFYCEQGAWKLNNKVTIHDHEPEGTLTLSGVMERSSNVGAAKIGLKLGVKDYYLYAKSFGFGAKAGLGFYGESAGILRPLEKFALVDLAVGSFGHGIAATPLQVIGAYSALANGGRLYEPRLVHHITEYDGKEVFRNSPVVVRQAVTPETSNRVKAILRAVVEKGTGKPAAIPGYSMGGKTGTANKIDPRTGKYMKGRNVASFCGFFPFDHPRYTILVVMDSPKGLVYGGDSAAPVFREIAKRIITIKGIKPDVAIAPGAAPAQAAR